MGLGFKAFGFERFVGSKQICAERSDMASRGLVSQVSLTQRSFPGLLSNQGEKSINLYFIMVPLRKKVLKYGTPKPSFSSAKKSIYHI